MGVVVIEELGEFPADLEPKVRQFIVRHCQVEDAGSSEIWALGGKLTTFYQNTWFGCFQRKAIGATGPGTPLYFLVQTTKRRKKVRRLIPIANVPGSIARANRELKLKLSHGDLLEYLWFYYAFTPKAEPTQPRAADLTQYAVPRFVRDLRYEQEEFAYSPPKVGIAESKCSEQCVVLGAIWRYLDASKQQQLIPLKFKRRGVGSSRVSARVAIQYADALFAVDVTIPETSGIPILTNLELLYQGALVEPAGLSSRTLPMPDRISFEQIWLTLKNRTERVAAKIVRAIGRGISWAFTFLFAYLWALSALFPILEIFGIPVLRRHLEWLSSTLGLQEWSMTLLQLTILAIAAFLSIVFYLTSMDKIFNLVFKLLPRSWERWLAKVFNPRMDRRDRDLIAVDTFRKRASMALRLLVLWTGYAVLAFASLQIAINLIFAEQKASSVEILWSLSKQAALNVPIVVYAIIRFPWLFGGIRPVEEGILNPTLLLAFHTVMAVVIVKGVLRIWVFTKEATPRAFYRRLLYHK